MTGLGSAGVLEVAEDDRGNTYRAVYTVKFGEWVYVLPCFQKKSKSGIKTPKEDMDLDPRQTQDCEAGLRGLAGQTRSTLMTRNTEITIEEGSTNVYADLGYADAAEMQRKSQLAALIARAIKARRLTQQDAAELLGIDQSKVSRITRGQFRGVSEPMLLELVTKLGHDVKIVVGPVRRRAGKIELQFALPALRNPPPEPTAHRWRVPSIPPAGPTLSRSTRHQIDPCGRSRRQAPSRTWERGSSAPPRANRSNQTTPRHRYRIGTGYHQMIEHPHVDQRQRSLQRLRQELVGTTRFCGARRMVVRLMCPESLCARALSAPG